MGISKCCTCGYEWETGQDGSHFCSDRMARTIRDLRAENADLRNAKDEATARAERAEAELVELHAKYAALEAQFAGPDGFATWKDAAIAERVRRVAAEARVCELITEMDTTNGAVQELTCELLYLRGIEAELKAAREQKPVARVTKHSEFGGGHHFNIHWLKPEAMKEGIDLYAGAPAPAAQVQLRQSRAGRVYVAGPMTGIENYNFPAFNAAANRLRGAGFTALNPADHGVVDGAEWGDYLRYDIGILATCERIHLLDDWEKSKGAALEVSIATALGMEISYETDGTVRAPAPAAQVPQEWPAMLRTGRFIRREAWNPEAFIWFRPGDERNHSTVMLYTHGKIHAGWIGLHCDHHSRDWVYCDDHARALLQQETTGK